MRGYYLSYGKWKILYVPHNLLSLVSRDSGIDNCLNDRFVFDFDPTFINNLDALIRKNGFEYLEKLGWRKKSFEIDNGIMEKLRERCFDMKNDLAKRVGKIIFYNAINELELSQA